MPYLFQSQSRNKRVSAFTLLLLLWLVAISSTAQSGVDKAAATTARADRPWMNEKLSPDERASLVVQQMTLDEKLQMVHGIGWGPLRP